MMIEYRKQLMDYLETLMKLNESGFTCTKEIQETIKELHSLMGFDKKIPLNKLDYLIRNNNHNKLVAVTEEHRGIGKTTKLLELAKEYNIPIIVGTYHYKQILLDKDPSVRVYVAKEDGLRGFPFPNGVLIDESVTLEQYADLLRRKINIRGGFFPTDKYFV